MGEEGIMALPQGMPMQGEQPVNEPFTVSSADSYDAAQSVLEQRSPEEYAVLKETMRQNLADVELSAAEISSMLEALVYMSQNPAEYSQLRQNLISNGALDEEDLPEEFDPQFLGVLITLLHEMQLMQFEGAQAPMMDMPPVQGEDAMQGLDGSQPMAMAQGGLADVAAYMASQGRNGDTMLAHITPGEAQMLRAQGGSGTINPVTGLPEFFLKKLFKKVVDVAKKIVKSPVGKIIATVGLATLLGPTAIGATLGKAGTAALVSGGVTMLGGGSLKEALMAGATGYFGAGGTIGGVNPIQSLGSFLPGAAGGALNTGLATGLVGAGIGKLGGLSTRDALKMGLTSGLSAAALQTLQGQQAPTEAQAQPGAQADGPFSGVQNDGTARSMLSSQPQLGQQMAFDTQPIGAAAAPKGFFESMFSPAAPAAGPGTLSAVPGTSAALGAGTAAPAILGAAPGAAASLGAGAAAAAPAAAAGGMFSGMIPKIGLGLGVAALAGGFKDKTELNPISEAEKERYLENVKIAKERDAFIRGGGYGLETPQITPRNPIVPTDYSAALPMQPSAPTMAPTGITRAPGNIAQPYNLAGMYGVPLVYGQNTPLNSLNEMYAQNFAKGGSPKPTNFPRKTGPINGPGTGTSDDIPAMLSDGEFVFTAKAVRNAGSGSRRKGAARMYKLMKMLEGGPVKGK
jgi:hypothetical protein